MPGCPHRDILPAPELSQNYHIDKAMFNCISPKESGPFFIVCTIRFVGKGQNRRSPKSGSSDFASGTALLNYNPAALFRRFAKPRLASFVVFSHQSFAVTLYFITFITVFHLLFLKKFLFCTFFLFNQPPI